MADDLQERTEPGTPRRRQKAREEGQIVRSRDLVSMAATAGILLVLWFGGSTVTTKLAELTAGLLRLEYGRNPVDALQSASVEAMLLLAPFFALAVLFALAAAVAQDGFLLQELKMDPNRINPVKGLQGLLSLNGLTNLGKNLVKFGAGAIVLTLVLRQVLAVLPLAPAMDVPAILGLSGTLLVKALVWCFVTFLLLAALDYLHMKWMFERSIRMTKQEVKEDYKQTEGDPLIRGRIKAAQREMAMRRMMQAVPKATVVITNPTHYAVAVRYDRATMAAPVVTAKGADFIAQKIREKAREHRVPIVEDKPLARALFKLPLDTAIPAELYRAVARILAYIYKLKGMAA